MIYSNAGDIFYLRLIMKHRAITGWEDSLTCNNVVYKTYQQAARAALYLLDENEAYLCFDEAFHTQMAKPNRLRGLFIVLTIDGHPTMNILSNPEFVSALTADYYRNDPELSITSAYLIFIREVQKSLKAHDKCLEDFGLHLHPITFEILDLFIPTELQEHLNLIDINSARNDLIELDN